MNPLKDQYNSLYASGVTFGGGKPIESVVNIPTYLQSGTVLDIGGGDGRNALYLAEQGFAVTVTDLSEVGLTKLQAEAHKRGLKINTYIGDVVEDGIDGMYDAMVCSFVLHHIDTAAVRKIFMQAQEHTNTNGVHVLATFANSGGLYNRNTKTERFYPDEAVFREIYSSWDIVELDSKEIITHARDKQGEQMKNYALSLIAVKP